MDIHRCPSNLTDIFKKANSWHYSRPIGSGALELGTVRGFDVALPIHFHHEDQITFVLSGRRRFVIHDEITNLGAGQGTYIPAGVLHRSLSENSELFCLNIYTSPGECAAEDLVSSLASIWHRNGFLTRADLRVVIEEHAQGKSQSSTRPRAETVCKEPPLAVGEAARLSGISREAFSRRFRKLRGIPPQAFQLIERLNEARRALRTGHPIAEVAAQSGFSDQSHLGRLFRRTFGVTPGQYRAGF